MWYYFSVKNIFRQNKKEVFYIISIEELELKYQEIIKNKGVHIDKTNRALSSLMSQIERDYNFPLVESALSKEQKESEIYKLYLKISNARNFEDSFYN